MKWIDPNKNLPEGVSSFKTMSDYVAVKIFSLYSKKIETAVGRYCHDRKRWFVVGGHIYNDENNVLKWLKEDDKL